MELGLPPEGLLAGGHAVPVIAHAVKPPTQTANNRCSVPPIVTVASYPETQAFCLSNNIIKEATTGNARPMLQTLFVAIYVGLAMLR